MRVVRAGGHGAIGAAVTERKRVWLVRTEPLREKWQVKHQPELSPARVAGSVSRGAARDVDVANGTFGHLWGEEGIKCSHAVMRGWTFSSVWPVSQIHEL